MRTRQVERVVALFKNTKESDRIRLGRPARENNVVTLHLNKPRNSRPCVLEHFLRLSSLFVRRRRVAAHSRLREAIARSGVAEARGDIKIGSLIPPHG